MKIDKNIELIISDDGSTDSTQKILEDYKDFYNQKTVPIILANCLDTGVTKKVGGYQDLLEYFKDEQ